MDYIFKNFGEFFKEIRNPKSLPFYGCYSLREFHRIERGYSPKTSEDQWHISYEGNTIFFYRAWTGECIYQIEIVKKNKKYYIRSAYVTKNPNKHHWTDEIDGCKLLEYLIDQYLLGKPVLIPAPFF